MMSCSTFRYSNGATRSSRWDSRWFPKAPWVTISEPPDGSVFRPGDQVILQGQAFDPETGVLDATIGPWNVKCHIPEPDDARSAKIEISKNGSRESDTK